MKYDLPWQLQYLIAGVVEREWLFWLGNTPMVALHHPVPENDVGYNGLIFTVKK